MDGNKTSTAIWVLLCAAAVVLGGGWESANAKIAASLQRKAITQNWGDLAKLARPWPPDAVAGQLKVFLVIRHTCSRCLETIERLPEVPSLEQPLGLLYLPSPSDTLGIALARLAICSDLDWKGHLQLFERGNSVSRPSDTIPWRTLKEDARTVKPCRTGGHPDTVLARTAKLTSLLRIDRVPAWVVRSGVRFGVSSEVTYRVLLDSVYAGS